MKLPRFFAAWPLLLAGLCATAPAADTVVTPEQLFPQLDGILKKAVAQSPRMISRAIDLEYAENNRVAARAGMLPSIGGYYTVYQAHDERSDQPENGRIKIDKQYYSFALTQPLFYWGDRRNGVRIGEIQQAISQGQFREGYRLLAQEIRASYLRLIINKLIVKRTTYQAETTRKALAQAEEQLKKKVISEAQIFGVRIDAERAEIGLERTLFDAETQKASFARLTGAPVLSDDEIPDLIPAITDQTAAIGRMLAGFLEQKDPVTFEAANYRKAREVEKLNLTGQKNRLKPKFNFVAGISQDEQNYTINVAQKYAVNSYFGGVSINWTLFDGFSAGAGVRNQLAKLRQMEIDYRNLTENLAIQAQTQVKLIGFSIRNASVYDRLLVSGEGNVNYRAEQFARGVIKEEDVSAARLGFYDAQINAFTSRVDYFSQLAAFLGTVQEDPVLANLAVK